MSAVVLGGLIFQLPMGIVADRYDRRIDMSVALISVGVAWGTLAFFVSSGLPFVCLPAMAVDFGGAMSSVYPLCVAQTFDGLERKYYIAASIRLLMVYSIGATIGPPVRGDAHVDLRTIEFFMFESALAVLYAAFVLTQVATRPALADDQQEPYVALPDVTPIAMAMDPQTEPAEKS